MNRRSSVAPPLVSLRDAAIRSGERVLFAGTNWDIHPGEQWAIMGPNGSGKSLLAAALAGRAPVVQGTLTHRLAEGLVEAHDLGAFHARRSHVVLVSPADHSALATRHAGYHQARWNASESNGGPTVEELLGRHSLEALNPFEVLPEPADAGAFTARRQEVIDLFRLVPLLHRRVKQLSNGETRKLLLARAALRGPRLLVLDDPFGGLDIGFRAELHRILNHLAKEGTTLVIATLRRDEVPACTTHLLHVDRCRITGQERIPQDAASGAAHRRGRRWAVPVAAGRRGKAIVEIRGATVRYGETSILDGVDWTICRGEHWALLGPNGAGKSTLLSLLLADNPQAYANHVRLFGRRRGSGDSIWDIKMRIGWVAPELLVHYPPGWSCLDVVLSGLHASVGLYCACSPVEAARGHQALVSLGLGDCASTPLSALSQGQQRLVLLARAFVGRPELLILDEPCQGLDIRHTRRVNAAVDRVAGQGRASIIYVTHHEEQIPACVSHVLRLTCGRVKQSTTNAH